MIRSLLALSILTFALPLSAFAGTAVDVKIEGMHCAPCAKMVNDELAKLPEIEKGSISVTLERNNALLTLKNNDAKSLEAVKAAVVKAGYKVSKIDVVPAAKSATKVN